MKWVSGAATSLAVLLTSSTVHGHIELRSPEARYGPEDQKFGPCGRRRGSERANVTTFEAGQTIEVVWEETVDHPSHYRIMFDADGQDDFFDPECISHCDNRRDPEMPTFALGGDPMILLDGIGDEDGPLRRANVTLPNIECDNCTLQLIQVMYDKRPYEIGGNDLYYTCADLVLERAPGPDAGSPSDAGPRAEGDAGAPGAEDAGRRDAASRPVEDSGSSSADAGRPLEAGGGSVEGACSASGTPSGALTLLGLGICWLVTRSGRSRRRRH